MAETARLATDPIAKALATLAAARGVTPTLLAGLIERRRGGAPLDRRSLQRSLLAARPRRDTLLEIAQALDAGRLGRVLLDDLTAHDAEQIRDDVEFAIIHEGYKRFRRARMLWLAVSKALRATDDVVRYAAYKSFEIAAHGLDERKRDALDALAQTLGFDLAPYERMTADRVRSALEAIEQLCDALSLSNSELDTLVALLLNHGVNSATIRAAEKESLAETMQRIERRATMEGDLSLPEFAEIAQKERDL